MKKILIIFCVWLASLHASFAQVNLANGIIAEYPFNGNAKDAGVNSLNGTAFGNVTLTTDRFGNANSAYDFGGTNGDYMEVPHNPLLNFSNQSFSISVWAMRTGFTGNGMIISKGGDISDGYSIRVSADSLNSTNPPGTARFRLGNPSRWLFDADDIRTPTNIQKNIWTNYVGTYDNNTKTMLLYENGVQMSRKVIFTNYVQNTTLPFTFGQHSSASKPITGTGLYPFQGKIDDAKIYNRTVNDCEAYSLFNQLPTVAGIQNFTVCKGKSFVLSASGLDLSKSQSYKWFDQSVGGTNLDSNQIFTVNGINQSTTYYLTYLAGSCDGTTISPRIPITITVPTSTVSSLNISGRKQFCNGAVNEPFMVNTVSGAQYQWNITNKDIATGQGTGNVTITFTATGSYFLTVKQIASNGCISDSTLQLIDVYLKPSTSKIFGDDAFCKFNVDTAAFYVNGRLNSTYKWLTVGGNTSITGQGTNKVKVNLDSNSLSAQRTIKVIEMSDQGCYGDTVSKTINIDILSVRIKAVSVAEADEKTIEISYTPANQNSTLIRNLTSITSLGLNSGLFADKNLKTDTSIYKYQIKSKDLCGKISTSPVHQNMVLKGNVNPRIGSANLTWSAYLGWQSGVKLYEIWRSIGVGGNLELYTTVTDSTQTTFVPANDGPVQVFRIKAISKDANVASWSNSLKLSFDNSAILFNAFTPNGDGKNDTWIVDRLNLYPKNKLTILDKWGNSLFEKNNYQGEWDGKLKGEDLPTGTYYYLLDLGNGAKPFAGTVTLLR